MSVAFSMATTVFFVMGLITTILTQVVSLFQAEKYMTTRNFAFCITCKWLQGIGISWPKRTKNLSGDSNGVRIIPVREVPTPCTQWLFSSLFFSFRTSFLTCSWSAIFVTDLCWLPTKTVEGQHWNWMTKPLSSNPTYDQIEKSSKKNEVPNKNISYH